MKPQGGQCLIPCPIQFGRWKLLALAVLPLKEQDSFLRNLLVRIFHQRFHLHPGCPRKQQTNIIVELYLILLKSYLCCGCRVGSVLLRMGQISNICLIKPICRCFLQLFTFMLSSFNSCSKPLPQFLVSNLPTRLFRRKQPWDFSFQ